MAKPNAQGTVKIREASIEDLAQISALQAKFGLESKPSEDWNRFWRENPARDGLPMGWVIADEARGTDREVVGFLGNIPMEYVFHKKRLLAAVTHSLVVEEGFRQHVLSLVTRFTTQKGPDLFLNTTANRETERIFSALRFRRVPSPDYDVSLCWVTEPRGAARSFLVKRGMNVSIARVAAVPISALLRVLAGVQVPKSNTRVDLSENLDERLERFWKKLSNSSPCLLAARDLKTLRWRCERALKKGRMKILATHDEQGEIRALAVFYREDALAFGLKRLRFVDFHSLDADLSDLDAIVARAIGICRDDRIHLLEAIGFDRATRARLKALGARERRLPAWMFLYKARDAELDKALENEESWNPSSFDGDGCL